MITAVVLTKNEEKNIIDCLESLKWCDEILLIDDNSDDNTRELAKRTNVEIIREELNGNFSLQRNIGLEKAKSDWVLFVDADERITDSLRYEIQTVISDPLNPYDGFKIKRKDIIWGKELKHGETADLEFLRLAKKSVGKWQGMVHERWRVKGKVGKLNNALLHFPHPTIKEFLTEINVYTDIRSRELYEKGVKANALSIIVYPKVKFVLNYFIKRGFLDGLEGLVFALIMSFHSFLVRGKLWMLWQKK